MKMNESFHYNLDSLNSSNELNQNQQGNQKPNRQNKRSQNNNNDYNNKRQKKNTNTNSNNNFQYKRNILMPGMGGLPAKPSLPAKPTFNKIPKLPTIVHNNNDETLHDGQMELFPGVFVNLPTHLPNKGSNNKVQNQNQNHNQNQNQNQKQKQNQNQNQNQNQTLKKQEKKQVAIISNKKETFKDDDEDNTDDEEDFTDDELSLTKDIAIQGTNIVLETDEDIRKWIQERKKNWPTEKRVEQRREEKDKERKILNSFTISNVNKNSSTEVRRPGRVCKFWLKTKRCRNGANCKFLHEIPKRGENDNNLNSNKLKSLPNHKIKLVHGIPIQIPQRFTPMQNKGKSLHSLLVEGEQLKDENIKVLDIFQKLVNKGTIKPNWDELKKRLKLDDESLNVR